jgi:prepilin peptidase CpaA
MRGLAGQDEVFHLFAWGLVACAAAVGAALDVWSRRIPNWLTLPVLLVGLACGGVKFGLWGLGDGVLGCLLMAAPYLLLFAFARGGAGDAKLMGALGAWLGVHDGALALAGVAATGLVFGVAYAVARRQLQVVLARIWFMTFGLMLSVLGLGRSTSAESTAAAESEERRRMPYGPAIFVGVCLAGGISLWLR